MAGAVSPYTRTIVTELVVDNTQEGLLPGAYVNVSFSFPSDPDILIIPSQALLFRADGMQVALVDGQNHVHLQNVSLGHNLGLDVQIVAGLKATDRIVANPSLGLLEGQQVKVVQAAKGYEPGEVQRAGTPAPQLTDIQSEPAVRANANIPREPDAARQAARDKESMSK